MDFKAFWTQFYNTLFRNVDPKIRYSIGGAIILVALVLFVLSTRNTKKGEFIGNWFLFWISIIVLIIGILYMSI